MKALAPAILALLFSVTAAAQNTFPPRLLARPVCVGGQCDNVNRFINEIAPALSPNHSAGTLLVDGEDPLARCLERVERSRTREVAQCVSRQLFGMKAGAALRDTEHDGYLVVLLKEERNQGIQGHVVLLTSFGQVMDADLLLLGILPNGMGDYAAGRAQSGATILVDVTSLAERAAFNGFRGIPPRRDVINVTTPAGSTKMFGTALFTLK